MCYGGNFHVVLVRSCVACVLWGFLSCRHSHCRVVRCLQRGSGALPAGALETRHAWPGPLKISGNRGSGCVGTLGQGACCDADYPAGPYPVALIAWRPSATAYDPGVRGSGLALVGDVGIWHAVRAAVQQDLLRPPFAQALQYLLGGSGKKLAAYQVSPGTFAILRPLVPAAALLATLVACPRAGES
jgi:hypothetical protein